MEVHALVEAMKFPCKVTANEHSFFVELLSVGKGNRLVARCLDDLPQDLQYSPGLFEGFFPPAYELPQAFDFPLSVMHIVSLHDKITRFQVCIRNFS